ncbi:RNase HII [Raineyella antarctica]|uniref:Ribonuclease HII n=1 Tax=Raineyella antarctica TaxID=1577474 RepID=A0A1G6HBA4_9ACTN|nr:ribonuclease HII [Raineyella antarctica]SDB91587.1 RNase HII [Raineyella antarctica]
MSTSLETSVPDLYGYERALVARGFGPVAGADEAGRGACAGPLVAAAAILDDSVGAEIPGLRDSKLMTPRQRDVAFDAIREQAVAWAVVAIAPGECDHRGLQPANLEALRRALLRLDVPARYCLTDGFAVDGLGVPGLALWKGDRVAACVAAASVLAKVTRDRIMVAMEEEYPGYGFAQHKGYSTRIHQDALEQLGPCPQHRMSYDNVIRAARLATR